MNILQLTLFAWISTWVLCESVFPGMDYKHKILACVIGAFAAAYANNAHRLLWNRIKRKTG
ncbi:MAG: hypothetical protein JSR17_04445 [Proteobacteria bacterium]|nr:hypothetical protein [Pseudomonadota bacterium]